MARYKVAVLLDRGIEHVSVEADSTEQAEKLAADLVAARVQPDDCITWIQEELF